MNVLLVGSGGREHALAWGLARSARCARLWIAPGNPGTATCGSNVALDPADHRAVADFCRKQDIGLVVIGPEAPLVAGLADDLRAAGLLVFGPGREAARLEGSKAFTKELCQEAGIPTAAFACFTEAALAKAYVRRHGAPIVVKADGLAAGKGVVVAASIGEAEAAIDSMLAGGLGAAGSQIVIEECLVGEEASFFALVDGTSAIPLAAAQDHKRVGDGDTGPNTGGMGAFSPAPIVSNAVAARVMDEIIQPTAALMKARGTPFSGVLFAGLMITAEGPKLIEYNVRFGDPECQVLAPRLDGDLLEALLATAEGRLADLSLRWHADVALTVILAAKGYPGTPLTGGVIEGLDAAQAAPGVIVFQAGTRQDAQGRLLAAGGRVLAVTALAPDLAEARRRAYAAIDKIDWPDGFCRRDIGCR
jgi:phosphoribosylamine---glycine ligase